MKSTNLEIPPEYDPFFRISIIMVIYVTYLS